MLMLALRGDLMGTLPHCWEYLPTAIWCSRLLSRFAIDAVRAGDCNLQLGILANFYLVKPNSRRSN